MKITLRVPTKTTYSYIEVELKENESITKAQAKKIIDSYYLISKEYWGEVQDKITKAAKPLMAPAILPNDDITKEKATPLLNVATSGHEALIDNIESASNLAMLECLEGQVKSIKGDKVRELVVKKYNDKKIILTDQQNDQAN